ncbi:MAG: hypothetical protein PHC46_03960 [Clostridia bacterium]|nr:hypothetical protein [Clostridia bacterium]
MNYNDNFVLPPDDVLEKMRVAYQSSSAKTHILNDKTANNVEAANLPQRALDNLYRSNFYASELKRITNNRYTRQKIQDLLDKSQNHINEFGNLYNDLQKYTYKPKTNLRMNYCANLKEAISAEIDVIEELLDLWQMQINETQNKVIYSLIRERFNILKELNIMFSNCSYRRF